MPSPQTLVTLLAENPISVGATQLLLLKNTMFD